jgi:hypothetical protein
VLLTLKSNALAAMSALMAGVMLSLSVDVPACRNRNRVEGCYCSCCWCRNTPWFTGERRYNKYSSSAWLNINNILVIMVVCFFTGNKKMLVCI